MEEEKMEEEKMEEEKMEEEKMEEERGGGVKGKGDGLLLDGKDVFSSGEDVGSMFMDWRFICGLLVEYPLYYHNSTTNTNTKEMDGWKVTLVPPCIFSAISPRLFFF
jgi:hypothetical protein